MTKTTSTRFSHFQVVIQVPLLEELDFKIIPDQELLPILENSEFVRQNQLEDILSKAKIISKNSLATLDDYKGQLEQGSQNKLVHWQLYIRTSKQTVKTQVLNFFLEALKLPMKHASVQVTPIQDIESSKDYVLKEGRLELLDSDWFPGIISKEAVDFKNFLAQDTVTREVFSDNARSYQKYLLKIIRGESNDRLIYWILDFHGKTGKSIFAKAIDKAGLAITADIDDSRAFSKEIILEAQNYRVKYGKDPSTVVIDLSRQVSERYLDGFYGILENLKNGRVRSTFQNYSYYEWFLRMS